MIARIFGFGETAEDCLCGHLECELAFKVDQEHFIKAEWWVITKVTENTYGEPLLHLKRSAKVTWKQTLYRLMNW